MDLNIKIDAGGAEDSFSSIESAIRNNLITKKNEFGMIAGLFAKSQGEQTKVLKELIMREQEMVGTLADLFDEMIKMLRDAASEFGNVENNYANQRVE